MKTFNTRGLGLSPMLCLVLSFSCVGLSHLAHASPAPRPPVNVEIGGPTVQDPIGRDEAAFVEILLAATERLTDIENAHQSALHDAADSGAGYSELRSIAMDGQKQIKKSAAGFAKSMKTLFKARRKELLQGGASAAEIGVLESIYLGTLGDLQVHAADSVDDVFATLANVADDL